MKRFFLFLAVLAGSGACSKTYDVWIDNELDPGAPATVLLWGEPVQTATESPIHTRVKAEVTHRAADGTQELACVMPACGTDEATSVFTVRLETAACGPVELCVQVLAPEARKRGPLHARLLERRREEFDVCTDEVYRIWVDNRGGAARLLRVGGGAPHPVAANTTASFEVAAPPCRAMAEVTLDGKAIGSLPDRDDPNERHGDLLVDPEGTRCYTATRFSYGPGGFGVGPETQDLDRERLHVLRSGIDHFLERVPSEVEAYGGFAYRTQLLDSDCAVEE